MVYEGTGALLFSGDSEVIPTADDEAEVSEGASGQPAAAALSSFTALVQSETLNLDLNAVLFREETGSVERPVNATSIDANVAGTTVSSPTYATVEDPLKYFSFLMHASELTSTVLCLGQMLHVITESLIARLLGSRLALRGPDGSIIRATRHLAKALASTTRTFFTGCHDLT